MRLQVLLILAVAKCVLSDILPLVQEFQNEERMLRTTEEDLSNMVDKVSNALASGYDEFLATGMESRSLKNLTRALRNIHSPNIMRFEVENMDVIDQIFMCTLCRSTTNVLFRTVRNNECEPQKYKEFTLFVCTVFKIYTLEVCEGVFDLNFPIIHHVVKTTNISSYDFCGVMLQPTFCSSKTSPSFNFEVKLNSTIKAPKEHKSKIPAFDPNGKKILHITDIHYDPLYEPDSLAECEEPMCCRKNAGGVKNKTQRAGYWTDYRNCDAPRHLVEEFYRHVNETHQHFDYVYFTGDVIDHGVWKTTYEYIEASLRDQYKLMKKFFPNHKLYPCIGNHESQPLNQFAPEYVTEKNFTTKWLYELLAEIWAEEFNLPTETLETIRQGGYYTLSPQEGFRVIVLNNNDCYGFNWWLYGDPQSLCKPLQWLNNVLYEAERNHEKVHILAHIPSGSGSCWHVWSREFTKIIERFRDTITGIFNGHTHYDEMNTFYSAKENYAINVAWNGGSLTPYGESNPNYRIYTCDPNEMHVLDHETWIFNLTEANIYGAERRPVWYKEYSFRDFFELEDLSPKSLNDLFEKFASNPELLRKYHHMKWTMSDVVLNRPCDHKCLKKDLCELAVTHYKDQNKCKELKAIYDETVGISTEETTSTTKKPRPTKTSTTQETTEETTNSTTEITPTTTCDPTDTNCSDGASVMSSMLPLTLGLLFKIYFVN